MFRRPRTRPRLRRNTSGQSLVEFAIVLPLLLLMFFGIFEFGRFYFTKLTLQHAVREATRFAITGNTLTDPTTGDPISRANSIVRVILENTNNLDVDLAGVTITPANGGGPEEIVRVRVDFQYDLTMPVIQNIVPNGHVNFSFSTAMRNEAFY